MNGSWLRASARRGIAGIAIAAVLAVAACGGDDDARFSGKDAASTGKNSSKVSLELENVPDGATDVLTSAELRFKTNGKVSAVTLTSADGQQVAGTFGADGQWIPGQQLAWGTEYTVRAVAEKGSGEEELTSTFTTMAQPGQGIDGYSYVEDGATVGVGLPLEINFDGDIPADKHAEAEKRFFITTNPVAEGSWYWLTDKRVHWRPKEYWQPGTTVNVRLGIGGMDFGGVYGMHDVNVNFTIGNSVVTKINNATKTMTVTENGVVIKEFPISLGKPSTPTPSGTLVAMGTHSELMYDSSTYGVPVNSPDGYRMMVYSNVRLTWGGIFVHAAPWSVGDQGVRNVSHGCINVAPENAQWFYEFTKVGDVVVIEGTEEAVGPGDGWTDWNVSWDEYQQGSALR